jgi:hypothetical protein
MALAAGGVGRADHVPERIDGRGFAGAAAEVAQVRHDAVVLDEGMARTVCPHRGAGDLALVVDARGAALVAAQRAQVAQPDPVGDERMHAAVGQRRRADHPAGVVHVRRAAIRAAQRAQIAEGLAGLLGEEPRRALLGQQRCPEERRAVGPADDGPAIVDGGCLRFIRDADGLDVVDRLGRRGHAGGHAPRCEKAGDA